MIPEDQIIVLDYGGQYAHLIAKKIRDLGYFSQILPANTKASKLQKAKGIVISGGPDSVTNEDRVPFDKKILELSIPILGICLGHQLIGYHLGASISQGKTREYGKTTIQTKKSVLMDGCDDEEVVWMSHFDVVESPPAGFDLIASTAICPTAGMENSQKEIYSIQFHPEVTHTDKGLLILKNFLKRCPMQPNWQIKSLVDHLLKEIKQEAGQKNVFILVSGGIDSTVCFVLLNQALGSDRVFGLHVDTGLMRKDESQEVQKILNQLGLKNFIVSDHSSQFIEALQDVYDPETKRRIIGKLFLEVQKQELKKLGLNSQDWLLGQGTLYPDRIESGESKHAHTIKTHHNRIAEVEELIKLGKVIEPLKDLYKDEVREVGSKLGLPESIVWRHTFPGPGLAVQQLCAKKAAYPPKKDELYSTIQKILQEHNLDPQSIQAHLLPIKSVGVQGDERSYAHTLALLGPADWKTYEHLAITIANRIPDINRVIRLVEPIDLEWELMDIKPSFITAKRLEIHRQADYIANQILKKHNLERTLYEFPVILFPVSFQGGESIALRPLYSENVMTVEFAKLPWPVVTQIAQEILQIKGLDAVFYDVTNKPPATVQWE